MAKDRERIFGGARTAAAASLLAAAAATGVGIEPRIPGFCSASFRFIRLNPAGYSQAITLTPRENDDEDGGKPDLRDLFEQLRSSPGFLPRCFVTERPKYSPCKDDKLTSGMPCSPVTCSAAAVQLAASYPVVAKPIPRGFFDSPLQSLVACRSSYLAGLGPGLSGGEQFGLGPGRSQLHGSAGGPGGATGPLGFPLPATFPWAATARGKPRRGMMRRAVFSDAQRQGLEKRFQIQKYISKPDRKKLAEKLGLKDSQ
ncbi:hypothetical protein HPB47_025057, partial [Ixodes persulcatus]